MIPILLRQKQFPPGVNTPWVSPQSHLVPSCVKVTNDGVTLPPGSHVQSVYYTSSPTEDTTVKPEGVSVAWSPESVRVLDSNEIISEIQVLLRTETRAVTAA